MLDGLINDWKSLEKVTHKCWEHYMHEAIRRRGGDCASQLVGLYESHVGLGMWASAGHVGRSSDEDVTRARE